MNNTINHGTLFGKGIAFPPRIGSDGRIAWSEGETNIREAIRIILMTEQSERLRLPDFGSSLRRFLFEPNTVTTRHLIQDSITRALEQWEPRIQIDSVDIEADPGDPQTAIATISYKLVATQTSEKMSLNINLAG